MCNYNDLTFSYSIIVNWSHRAEEKVGKSFGFSFEQQNENSLIKAKTFKLFVVEWSWNVFKKINQKINRKLKYNVWLVYRTLHILVFFFIQKSGQLKPLQFLIKLTNLSVRHELDSFMDLKYAAFNNCNH